MVDRANSLVQFSDALVERSAAAKSAIAAVRLSGTRHITAAAWRPDVVITSEQSLPEREEFELETAGEKNKAKLAGRDPGTNIAVLKLEQRLSAGGLVPVAARVGLLVREFREILMQRDAFRHRFHEHHIAIANSYCQPSG